MRESGLRFCTVWLAYSVLWANQIDRTVDNFRHVCDD